MKVAPSSLEFSQVDRAVEEDPQDFTEGCSASIREACTNDLEFMIQLRFGCLGSHVK
jgi:hypothetical protein